MNPTLAFAWAAPLTWLVITGLVLFLLLLQDRWLPPTPPIFRGTRKKVRGLAPLLSRTIVEREAPSSSGPTRERRRCLRRSGHEVAVLVSRRQDREAAVRGQVVERSRTGLLLFLPNPVAVGSSLYVLSPNAPDDVSWVKVEVKHVRQHQGRCLAGCRFVEALPWRVLLLFG